MTRYIVPNILASIFGADMYNPLTAWLVSHLFGLLRGTGYDLMKVSSHVVLSHVAQNVNEKVYTDNMFYFSQGFAMVMGYNCLTFTRWKCYIL